MTRPVDRYAYHIDLIDGPDTLRAAWNNPDTRWYAQRRLHALAATGALLAVAWNPLLHPRGRDGKFIERFGWVRWLDKNHQWQTGWVKDIDPLDGELTIRRRDGTNAYFPDAKTLYSRPKPKASLTLPNVITKETPPNWKQVGGQGGSNPGALFEIDGSFADQPADLSARSGLFNLLNAVSQPGTQPRAAQSFDTVTNDATTFVPADVNMMVVPSMDGTKGRYDTIIKALGSWYRVPQSGSMTVDDLFRPELKVDPANAFGDPGTPRRHTVLADLGTHGTLTGNEFDAEDIARMVQQTASPLPKVGDRYYVKTMNLPERARNEALANDFYELLGIPVPEVAVGGDGKTISSKLVGDTVPFDPNNPAHVKAAQNGFVADAWLANWDVIGLEFDNIQIDSDGNAWRIDAGGAMAWRAMGKPKGAMFGESVGELDSLRNPAINHNSAKVYGGITQSHLGAQAEVLQGITPGQIQALADAHDLPELGPTLIARRKSILDQLGIEDPPAALPEPGPPPPTTVFNPVEAVQQMGKPPTAAADSWRKFIGLQTTSPISDFGSDLDLGSLQQLVFLRNDDLWVLDSEYEKGNGSHKFLARNLYTGQKRRMTLFEGSDQPHLLDYVAGGADNTLDDFIDTSTPLRDLAIAEFVARHKNTPLAEIPFGVDANDPANLNYSQTGLTSFGSLLTADDQGRFGPADDRWPLRHGDGTLWDIANMPANEQDDLVLVRRTAGGDNPDVVTQHLQGFPDTFKTAGPWFMPANDATAAIWRSKFDPPPDTELHDPNLAVKIDAKQQQVDDLIALLEPVDKPELDAPGSDDGLGDVTELPPDLLAQQQGQTAPFTADDELEALLAEEQAIADKIAASAEPVGTPTKITNDVVDALGAGTPLLSTEMAAGDVDMLNEQLLNKNVVVLPIAAHDNPDWESGNLGSANGLGTVVSIETKQKYTYAPTPGGSGSAYQYVDVVHMRVQWASGGYSWVIGGDASQFPKVVIPVETAPQATQPVFKQNGDIIVNGVKVGTHWKPYSPLAYATEGVPTYQYGGVIDAEHSLNGKPLHFTSSKAAQAKKAATNLVVPIAPKPTKPKSSKVLATEAEVKKLNDDLIKVETSISLTEADLAKAMETGTPIPTGKPLADGSYPAKGDWVFSTKDGTWAQVKQLDPKLGPKHTELVGNYIKVAIPVVQPDGTTKWKWTNRPKDTLVSGAGPNAGIPFVLQTKALTAADGTWYGPGTVVSMGAGNKVTVVDTTVDGKVKIMHPDGTMQWALSSYVGGVSAGTNAPTVKVPPGALDQAKVDLLNAELAALNDAKAKLAATIATTVVGKPKKKKDVGTPYPGPGGVTFKQPAWLAEQREAKGLKNMKDGYVPAPGMILRHNDGTQYAVYEMGSDWSSHKNSVQVAPVDQPWNYKWRAVSTMVVDHEAMLTDKDGDPLPIISSFDGLDWIPPTSGLLLRKNFTKGWYQKDPLTGQSKYRTKEVSNFYIVGYDGLLYNLDGTQVGTHAIQPGQPVERIGYIDVDHPGGKKLTASITKHQNLGTVAYAAIHDPNEPAGITVAKPEPKTTPDPDGPKINPDTLQVETPPAPTPEAPPPPVSDTDTPTGPLPVFQGKDPQGLEVPHPPTTSSSAGVPAYTAQGGPTTLDVAGVAHARSIASAIDETITTAKNNKKTGEKQWVSTYGLADHDVIEDMMVQTQTVRDVSGAEFVEVRFRLDINAARKNHTTFITSTTNEAGDWEFANRNAKNMVPGDLIAVRKSSGGGKTPKDALRPDGEPGAGKTPNATVIANPVLIGKNEAGNYDVWRTQVMTAGGDIGFIDLEDRDGADTIVTAYWDATKPRLTNGGKGLNPNAQKDGWSVKANHLTWDRAQSDSNVIEQHADGVKKVGGYNNQNVGNGFTLQRDYQGAHVEYRTSTQKNSADGMVSIRVPVDDPDAQRKISEAMELVGVSKEKQKPPDKQALVKMATNKVWEQFNPTYTRGQAPATPEAALTAIDNAVGAQLGRKATMDDISLRVDKDGRVQVLVSEDVSRAIVKKNGVKSYTHAFSSGGFKATVLGALTGENPGLMATTERWSHGFFFFGMSSVQDHPHDSADHLFLRMSKSSGSPGQRHAVFDPVAIHRHVDYYWQPHDSYGERQSDQLNWLKVGNPNSSNELMIQRRLEIDLWGHVVVGEPERSQWLDQLKKKGITTAPNGLPIEQFIVASGGADKLKTPPSFGTEIPLGSLPDTVPVAPPTAVV